MKYVLDGQESARLLFKRTSNNYYYEWLAFHKSPITSLHWKQEAMPAEEACRNWFEKQAYRYQNDLGGMNALIEKSSNRLVGHCGLLVQSVDDITELEIGYSLLPEFWKQGFAIEAAQKCKNFAFENQLSDRLISIISLTNIPSEKVALKNGMHVEKQTNYNGNKVNIFTITKAQWQAPTS